VPVAAIPVRHSGSESSPPLASRSSRDRRDTVAASIGPALTEIEFATGARLRIGGPIDAATVSAAITGRTRSERGDDSDPEWRTGMALRPATTDMRKGFDSLAPLVQQTLRRDPHGGHLLVFRGRTVSIPTDPLKPTTIHVGEIFLGSSRKNCATSLTRLDSAYVENRRQDCPRKASYRLLLAEPAIAPAATRRRETSRQTIKRVVEI